MPEYDDRYAGRTTETESGDTVQGQQIRQLYEVLGPTPHGGAANVGARIAAIEASISSGLPPGAHSHDGNAITTGIIDADRLGTGQADNLFLRGDGVWAYPSAEAQGLVVLNVGEAIPEAIPTGWIVLRRAEA